MCGITPLSEQILWSFGSCFPTIHCMLVTWPDIWRLSSTHRVKYFRVYHQEAAIKETHDIDSYPLLISMLSCKCRTFAEFTVKVLFFVSIKFLFMQQIAESPESGDSSGGVTSVLSTFNNFLRLSWRMIFKRFLLWFSIRCIVSLSQHFLSHGAYITQNAK